MTKTECVVHNNVADYEKEFSNEGKDIVKMQERIYTSLGIPKRLIKADFTGENL